MSYLDAVRYIQSHQVPYRIQDGRIQVLDATQLPRAFREYLDSNGHLGEDITATIIHRLQDDADPTLGGDLKLNNHALIGELEAETLVIDGGLL